jgi:hypothetical protein
MSIPCIDDKRGLIFTIDRDRSTVYQVESGAWARAANRWAAEDLPEQIRRKVAELGENGKPGAFVQFLQGEVGVYVICEKNIRTLPDAADDDLVDLDPPPAGARTLSAYDIVISAKDGKVASEGGVVETREGDIFVIGCRDWSRVVLEEGDRPSFVETTKEMLHLLDDLNGRNFLSMSPEKPDESLPGDLAPPRAATDGINCYVLNLARFQR